MDQYLDWIMKGEGDVMPLWIEPAKKLSSTDLKWMMRDHFEGTPLDMTKDIGAGPYDVPYRWRPMTYTVDGNEYMNERAIATQQTGFSFVADMNKNRHDAMKGILWFGTDDANTCVYLPVFSSTPNVPYELSHGNGDMLTLSWDANFWVNNYVANQAYNRYSQMIGDIRKVQGGLEDAILAAVTNAQSSIAQLSYADAQSQLETLTDTWVAKATHDYKALGDMLLVKYLDGNIKKQKDDGTFERTETGVAVTPTFGGYNERYYRSIVNEQGDRLKVIEVKK
jgi:dipeptidase